MTVTAENNLPGGFATWDTIIVTDDSGVTPTADASHNSGDFFSIGNTQVTITYTDGSSNSAQCIFTVTVLGESLVSFCVFLYVSQSKMVQYIYMASHNGFESAVLGLWDSMRGLRCEKYS